MLSKKFESTVILIVVKINMEDKLNPVPLSRLYHYVIIVDRLILLMVHGNEYCLSNEDEMNDFIVERKNIEY